MSKLPRFAAYGLFSACVLGALSLHTVPALLAGLLAFVLTRGLLLRLRKFTLPRALLSHELLAAVIVGAGSLLVLGGLSMLVARFLGGESLKEFMLTLADTVGQARQFLPTAVADYIPVSLIELKELLTQGLKSHANALAGAGTHMLHSLVLVLIGWIAGVLAAVRTAAKLVDPSKPRPLPEFAQAWSDLWSGLSAAFENVAWAQTKIAATNAVLTGIFLLLVMPALGWPMPHAKMLVLVTFLASLLPVVGNLISNTVICTLALSVAFPAALAALVFLVVVHKLEYFLAARIQGHEIGAQAWELLIVLFAFEILFGPAGMVAAPVVYAFVKNELKKSNWV